LNLRRYACVVMPAEALQIAWNRKVLGEKKAA